MNLFSNTREASFRRRGWLAVFCLAAATVLSCSLIHAVEAGSNGFGSPEQAVEALIDATREGDTEKLKDILGPGNDEVISSGDAVQDKADRERFLESYQEKNRLENQSPDKSVLLVGKDEWPFPIPVVKEGDSWRFDARAGAEEILVRRIGQNELKTIETLSDYVDAQAEYAAKDRNGDGILEYAQKIASQPGKQDGLYWEAGAGDEQSPFGPLVAAAAQEGYLAVGRHDATPAPYYGYFYRMLKAQGEHAPGGAYAYVVNGKMLFGFSLMAYPAEYGSSGIMTFMVNQEGAVYQKDLGEDTEKAATSLEIYDPDQTWLKVESP